MPDIEAPAIIMGPPRAGSTLLANVLDLHPRILCTDEARPFLAAARALRPLNSRRDYEERWLKIFEPAVRQSIIEFFLDLGARPGVQVVEKFPHYCDPYWEPENLETIEHLFPGTRYIFLTRNKDAVVRSMDVVNAVHDWLEHSANDIYDAIHRRADEWEHVVGDRMVRVDYDDGLQVNIERVLKFLDLPMVEVVQREIHKELADPTRYSTPTSW